MGHKSKLKSLPLNFGYCYSLQQLISDPKRVTENTSTLVDHFFTNSPNKITQSGGIKRNLSDDKLIY